MSQLGDREGRRRSSRLLDGVSEFPITQQGHMFLPCSEGSRVLSLAGVSPAPPMPRRRKAHSERKTRQTDETHTGLLLRKCHLIPVDLHAISQRHPQIGLLLRGHALPSLLDIGERRVADGVCFPCLLGRLPATYYGRVEGPGDLAGGRRGEGSWKGCDAEHCGGREGSGEEGKLLPSCLHASRG